MYDGKLLWYYREKNNPNKQYEYAIYNLFCNNNRTLVYGFLTEIVSAQQKLPFQTFIPLVVLLF